MSRHGSFMEDMPEHLMVDILSRLPAKTIIYCKCVCKKWLNIVSDSYFADIQLSRSPTVLMVYHNPEKEKPGDLDPGILEWVEVEDELDHHHLHHDPAMSLNLNLVPIFQNSVIIPLGTVNGLICLLQISMEHALANTYICNPVTREYMILRTQEFYKEDHFATIGVGLVTKEYKVIGLFQKRIPPNPTTSSLPSLLRAEVYTLGSGQWRSLGHIPYRLSGINVQFLNGHAHWMVADQDSDEKLCAFDFDKETFKSFPSPPSEDIERTRIHFQSLGVLKGCLCRCDRYDSKLTVWVMKEYGIKKSWHKEIVIEKSISPNLDLLALRHVYLIQGFKDGTILVESNMDKHFVYCPRVKTLENIELCDGHFNGFTFRPSFHRLHNLENERVHLFERATEVVSRRSIIILYQTVLLSQTCYLPFTFRLEIYYGFL